MKSIKSFKEFQITPNHCSNVKGGFMSPFTKLASKQFTASIVKGLAKIEKWLIGAGIAEAAVLAGSDGNSDNNSLMS